MSAQVPPSLKAADIARFVHRAIQLETAKPVIAYWCDYWTAQQILAKGLHSVDQDALTFTTNLMDKLEKFKSDHANDESVTDDVAGKAVVEQFATETFQRADNAMRADKVTKQTLDTFQAASTFFELLEIWGPLEVEVRQKVKFAKFHALRIARAIRNGEDPNASNPKPEPLPEELAPPLDPNDPEVMAINGEAAKPRQPSVVEIPDETHSLQADLARESSLNESIHPSRAPSVPPQNQTPDPNANVSPLPKDTESFYSSHQAEVSPVSPQRKLSVGGNYFPRVPSPSQDDQSGAPPALPSAPDTFGPPSFELPAPPSTQAGKFPRDIDPPPQPFPTVTNFIDAPPPSAPPGISPTIPDITIPSHTQPPAQSMTKSYIPQQPGSNLFSPAAPPPYALSQPTFVPSPSKPSQSISAPAQIAANVIVDDAAILKAQKHARWAISALNFEDVPTAIRELQAALQTLGAH